MAKILGRRYRFVDDYQKTVYVGANGKSKQKITYIAQWVCPLNEASAFARIVLTVRIATGVALAAVLAALLVVPMPLENKWYLPVTAAVLFPLLYAVMGAVVMPNRPKPMERMRFHKSFERSKGAAIVTMVMLGLAAIVWILCRILIACGVIANADPFSFRDGAYVFCVLLSAAACFAVIQKNKEIKTELRDNSACKPE